jgi:hypothetical protein
MFGNQLEVIGYIRNTFGNFGQGNWGASCGGDDEFGPEIVCYNTNGGPHFALVLIHHIWGHQCPNCSSF